MTKRHSEIGITILLAATALYPFVIALPAAAAETDVSTIETVTVTADRRNEDFQITPLAATVLSGDQLLAKGIVTVDDLQFQTPSLTVSNFGGGYDFNIRGIGQGEDGGNTPAGVVTYRDNVPVFSGIGTEEPYYDIADIEVLRGPQGTFGGTNAIGGAVYVTERNPELSGFGGYAIGQVGNYNDVALQGAVNIPLTDDLAVRVAMNGERRDSFWHITKGAGFSGDPGSLKELSGRVSTLWEPTQALRVLFKVDANYIDAGGYPADPTGSTSDPFYIGNNVHNRGIDASLRGVLDIKFTLGNGIMLRSITGVEDGRNSKIIDVLATSTSTVAAKDTFVVRAYSEELDIVSPDSGPLKWIAGAYGDYDIVDLPANGFDIGFPFGVVDYVLQSREKRYDVAGFGQFTYDLSSRLQLQAGVRYTNSTDKALANYNYLYGGVPFTPPSVIPCTGPSLTCPITNPGKESDSKVTGKVSLSWKLDETNFLYAFFATGHKAGGINSASNQPPTYKPEDVENVEIGWKPEFVGGHVRGQFDGYWNNYKRFQVTLFDPQTLSSPVLNAPTAELWGFEAQIQGYWEQLSFDLNAAYEHTAFGTFFAAPAAGTSGTTCNPNSGGNLSSCQNLSHEQLVMAPEWSFSGGVQYAFKLGNGDTLTPRLSYSYMSSQYPSVFHNVTAGGVPALGIRNLVNAQLSYQFGTTTLTAYATNLTDDHYISYQDAVQRHAGQPRQFGLRLTKSF